MHNQILSQRQRILARKAKSRIIYAITGVRWRIYVALFLGLTALNVFLEGISVFTYFLLLGGCAAIICAPLRYGLVALIVMSLTGLWTVNQMFEKGEARVLGLSSITLVALIGMVRLVLEKKPKLDQRSRRVILCMGIFSAMSIVNALRYEPARIDAARVAMSWLRWWCLAAWAYYAAFRYGAKETGILIGAGLMSLVLLGLKVALQGVDSDLLSLTQFTEMRGLMSEIYDPNYCMVAAVMAGAWMSGLAAWPRVGFWLRLMFVLAPLASLLATVYTASRTGVLAAMAGAMTAAILWRRKMLLLFPLLAILFVLAWCVGTEVQRERLLGIVDPQIIESDRGFVFKDAWNDFLARPLTGWGSYYYLRPDRETRLGAHNSALQILAEGGLIYFSAWLAVLGSMIWIALKASEDPEIWYISRLFLVCAAIYLTGGTLISSEFCSDLGGWAFGCCAGVLLGSVAKKNVKLEQEEGFELRKTMSAAIRESGTVKGDYGNDPFLEIVSKES